MMFFVGIICFILTCILYIIFINNESIIIKWINNLLDNINKNKIINISVYFDELQNSFLLIPKLIIIFLNNFFEWQILSFFSINHFNSSFFLYIIIFPFIYEDYSYKFWVFISSYILIVFFLLVFNEIIIIYSFSLEKNTIHEKRKRSVIDERDNEMGRISLGTESNIDELSNLDEENTPDDKSSIN